MKTKTKREGFFKQFSHTKNSFIHYLILSLLIFCTLVMTIYAVLPKDLSAKMKQSIDIQQELNKKANLLRSEREKKQNECDVVISDLNEKEAILKAQWNKHEGIIKLANELIQLETQGL